MKIMSDKFLDWLLLYDQTDLADEYLALWVHMSACVHKGDLMFQFTNILVLESSFLSSGVSIETSGVSLLSVL